MRFQRLARTALLLALLLVLQSLRLVMPLPPVLSMFLIGTLVNACLLVAVETVGIWPAIVLAFLAPITAYFQQMLLLPVFIVPVAIGNIVYAAWFWWTRRKPALLRLGGAAFVKTFLLYVLFTWLLTWVQLAPQVAAGVMLAMSWPQLVTGLAGGVLALVLKRRLRQLS